MGLRELCDKLGGRFKVERYDDEEYEVCRIPITGEKFSERQMKIHEVVTNIAELAKEELGLEDLSLGSTLHFSKWSRTDAAHVKGLVGTEDPKKIRAIEIEYDRKEKVYRVTPISVRGRGCTLIFGKYVIGGECEKNDSRLLVEGSVFF